MTLLSLIIIKHWGTYLLAYLVWSSMRSVIGSIVKALIECTEESFFCQFAMINWSQLSGDSMYGNFCMCLCLMLVPLMPNDAIIIATYTDEKNIINMWNCEYDFLCIFTKVPWLTQIA